MNAGRGLQQLSGCFVLPVEDSIEGWGQTIAATLLVHKSGGGTGFSFSRVRPKDDLVKSTRRIATGPLSPMKMIDKVTYEVKQGGTRRGANMAVLDVRHPDIRSFITSKLSKGELENFNISVALTEGFMKAHENNETYDLINPRGGKVAGKESAREIFDLIVETAHKTADPGIVFIDRINADNPTPEVGTIESTNPCGEQPLLPYESCNLGSISLCRFVENGKMDYERLGKCVEISVRFLDDVIDVNNLSLTEIEKMTKSCRKIGLGVMGWAEALVKMGIRYDSDEAIKKAEEAMKFINGSALKTSIELAEERGPFPNWKKSIYKNDKRRPRNATRTTIAPTGTIAIAAGLQGGGIEPFFSLSYTRYNAAGLDALREGKEPKEKDTFYEYNNLLGEIAQENQWFDFKNKNELWKKIAENHGSVRGIKEIPEEIQALFATAHDIEPEDHIRMQAAFQNHTNNAVSKTINFRRGTSVDKVRESYILAHRAGLKGITIYVDGSKDLQVLNLEDTEETVSLEEVVKIFEKARPKILLGLTRREKYGDGNKLYITENFSLPRDVFDKVMKILKEKGIPIEVFGNSAQFNPRDSVAMIAHGKAISKMLQRGITPDEIARIYVDLPDGTVGIEKGYFNLSLPDALGHALLDFPPKKKEGTNNPAANPGKIPRGIKQPCPECRSIYYQIIRQEGCATYTCCGHSPKCS